MSNVAVKANSDVVRESLRTVIFPGYSRDIVSFGFVGEITVDLGQVVIAFAPNTKRTEKVTQMVEDIETVVSALEGVDDVQVAVEKPFGGALEDMSLSSGVLTPLQAELLEDGITPQRDPMIEKIVRPDIAPEMGYGEDGPAPLGPQISGPDLMEAERYEGKLPVFQWEIDPQDPTSTSQEANVKLDAWQFHIWWQVHAAELTYASIQALADDTVKDGPEREHPVGRNVVVNLVYDHRRAGVVAIYGTARDFRPFVEAFRVAIEEANQGSETVDRPDAGQQAEQDQ